MNESRPYASLSGSLLARKGGAKPAMRPRPFAAPQMLDDLGWDDMGEADEQAHEHVPSSIAALTPAPRAPATVRDEPAPVHVQQRTLARHYAPEPVEAPRQAEVPAPSEAVPTLSEAVVAALRAPVAKPKKGRSTGAERGGRKAAFTLRLDSDRHLKLRLAVALTGRSAQHLVTGALDAFLETLPEVGALAQHVPARGNTNS